MEGNETSGLVEVFYNQEWRSVCDDKWTNVDADVVCRELDFLGFGEYILMLNLLSQSQLKLYSRKIFMLTWETKISK